MFDAASFGVTVTLLAVALLGGVVSGRITSLIQIPAPLVLLVGATAAASIAPQIHVSSTIVVEQTVSIALALILFDGGMDLGLTQLRRAVRPILLTGVVGTALTVALGAVAIRLIVGMDWYAAVLIAIAVAPTDPAVVFSVLGRRALAERPDAILKGEAGANDPVGIALLATLVSAQGLSWGGMGSVLSNFLLQMAIGLGLGALGGWLLLWVMRNLSLPAEALYPLQTMAFALLVFGVGSAAHGSGFLAVFVAGIYVGDRNAPYKREIERFHDALGSLAEIVAFVVLGLSLHLSTLSRADVILPGIGVAIALIAIRGLVVPPCLIGSDLRRNEQAFVAFTGLKGAVPILLGSMLLAAPISGQRAEGIVVVVVAFSVLVQGTLVTTVARWLQVPMSEFEPEPWALGVRLRHQPENVHRITVASGSAADGQLLGALELEGVWVSLVVRHGELLPVYADTRLESGDEVLVLGDQDRARYLAEIFTRQSP